MTHLSDVEVTNAKPRSVVTIFKIRGLSKSFGSIKALQDIDLDIYPGEVLGLLEIMARGNLRL